ncbi:hypothetical protein [Actinomadura sp. WMMA1423]|uniref:hypothetical protein n=1 Tax=Actinomadura sp. WMMA1423 TaxID=2591108 RepID=UPI0011475B72|nr:hypothetical protein [Actinomadura sp. WMMA1423]
MEQWEAVSSNQWFVLIEEKVTKGQSVQWALTARQPAGGDAEQARRLAAEVALAHQPQQAKRIKGRQVFQTGPDNWLVVVAGVKGEFHFRVSVGLLTAVTTS